jgi:predicted AlkP superfamily phosphohydrolase/phosphomutase
MNRTVLIGIDGGTFTILDPLTESGDLPNLKKFIDRGVRAPLISTPHPLTPPAWTSMITGRGPGSHGIFDFIWSEQRETSHYFTLHNFFDIRAETVWVTITRQGGQVGSLNFPLMSPPPKVDGYIVPGLVSWKHLGRNVHPSGLYAEMKELPGFNVKELAWDFETEKKAEAGVPCEEYEAWIEYHIRRERQWFNLTRYLMKNHPVDLTAILFDGFDKILHMGYRFADSRIFPEQPSRWEQSIRSLCLDYFRELDSFVGEICSLAGENARVFIASDHGFGPTTKVFRVNTWLYDNGYLFWRDLERLSAADREHARKVADQHFVLLDWDRTTAYARSASSNGIYIRVATGPGEPGVPREAYDDFRAKLVARLVGVHDPDTGKPFIKAVLVKEEAFPGAHNQQAPDLTLVMHDHGFISVKNKRPTIAPRANLEGTHYPAGIFAGRGVGICEGKVLPELSILDVAPAMLYSLGLPIPADFEGRFPEEVFESSFLKRHPCKRGETRVVRRSATAAVEQHAVNADGGEEVCNRLRALGYLE